jgi:hypothetical protein
MNFELIYSPPRSTYSNANSIVKNFLEEQWIKSVWSVKPYSFDNQQNCCGVMKVINNNYYNYLTTYYAMIKLWGNASS